MPEIIIWGHSRHLLFVKSQVYTACVYLYLSNNDRILSVSLEDFVLVSYAELGDDFFSQQSLWRGGMCVSACEGWEGVSHQQRREIFRGCYA